MKLLKIGPNIKFNYNITKANASVYCSVVVASEEGTELGQIEVCTKEMLAASTNRVVIKIRK